MLGLTAAGSIADTDTRLPDIATSIAAFEPGAATCAATIFGSGVQITNLTDPASPTPTASLGQTVDVPAFKSGTATCAAATGTGGTASRYST